MCFSSRSAPGAGRAGRLLAELALEPDLDGWGHPTTNPLGSISLELSPRARLVHIPESREKVRTERILTEGLANLTLWNGFI